MEGGRASPKGGVPMEGGGAFPKVVNGLIQAVPIRTPKLHLTSRHVLIRDHISLAIKPLPSPGTLVCCKRFRAGQEREFRILR